MRRILEPISTINKILNTAEKTPFTRLISVAIFFLIITIPYYAVIEGLNAVVAIEKKQDVAVQLLESNVLRLDSLVRTVELCAVDDNDAKAKAFYCDLAMSKFASSKQLLDLDEDHQRIIDNVAYSGMIAAAKNVSLRLEYKLMHEKKVVSGYQKLLLLVGDYRFALFVIMLIVLGVTAIATKFILMAGSEKKDVLVSDKTSTKTSRLPNADSSHECVFCTTSNSKTAKVIQVSALLILWISIATVASIYDLEAYYAMILGFGLCILNQSFGKWLSTVFSSKECHV